MRFFHLYEICSTLWICSSIFEISSPLWDFIIHMINVHLYEKCLCNIFRARPTCSHRLLHIQRLKKIQGVIFQLFFNIQRPRKMVFFLMDFILDIFMCLKVYQLNGTNNMCSQQGHCCMFQFCFGLISTMFEYRNSFFLPGQPWSL